MDQVKSGAFIAQLRRERGWTQEELGERLGVTNKTVSRWENGNYMPSIELLTMMGREFDVSLNELLEGRRLDDGKDFRAAADKNLASALERPYDRFWNRLERWLGRYGAFPLVTLALCLLLGACCIGMFQYRQMHQEDVSLPGTFACWSADYNGYVTRLYFTFDHDGRYYIFTADGEYLEEGGYTANGDVVTLDDGEALRWLVIKGDQIHDPAPWGGGLLTYGYIGSVPAFIHAGGPARWLENP